MASISFNDIARKSDVPDFARVMKVLVGRDSVGKLERHFGKGFVVTGGHPQGARIWLDSSKSFVIYADGFDVPTNGRDPGDVINVLRFTSKVPWKKYLPNVPIVRTSERSLGIWSHARLGMKHAEVIRAMRPLLPPPDTSGSTLKWKARGYSKINKSTAYQTWVAELSFEGDHLTELSISCM